MRRLGNESFEILADCEPLQRAWARDHSLHRPGVNWQDEICLAQLHHYRPEVVVFQATDTLSDCVRMNLKRYCPFIRLVALHRGFPGSADDLIGMDVLFIGTGTILDSYRKLGATNSHLLYHYFNDAVLEQLANDSPGSTSSEAPKIDFSFVGTSGRHCGPCHKSRYWALAALLSDTCLQAWIEEARSEEHFMQAAIARALDQFGKDTIIERLQVNRSDLPVETVRGVVEQVCYLQDRVRSILKSYPSHLPVQEVDVPVPDLPLNVLSPMNTFDPVFGLDMYRLLQDSKVTFNIHTNMSPGTIGNCRLFEATGVGSCLLTDWAPNISEIFEPDKEVVTYQTLDECKEKLRFLLDNEDVRRSIALAGQQRTLKFHTSMERCREMDEIIRKNL